MAKCMREISRGNKPRNVYKDKIKGRGSTNVIAEDAEGLHHGDHVVCAITITICMKKGTDENNGIALARKGWQSHIIKKKQPLVHLAGVNQFHRSLTRGRLFRRIQSTPHVDPVDFRRQNQSLMMNEIKHPDKSFSRCQRGLSLPQKEYQRDEAALMWLPRFVSSVTHHRMTCTSSIFEINFTPTSEWHLPFKVCIKFPVDFLI